MNIKRIVSLLVFFTALSSTAVNADNKNSFTPEQQAQIETIIHNYLVNKPEVLIEASQALQKKERANVEKKVLDILPTVAKQLFSAPGSPVEGNLSGTVTIVEFFDYQCPHCKRMTSIMHQLVKNNPEVRVVYKELPIFGDDSTYAAKAALAAQKQGKYGALQDALMGYSGKFNMQTVLELASKAKINVKKLEVDMKSPDIDAEIKANFNLANQLNLAGTPAFVVVKTPDTSKPVSAENLNATFIPGETDLDTLNKAIAKAKG